MSEPTQKSAAINNLLSMLAGKNREDTIRANLCMTCDGEAKEFKDELSRRDYCITGMCQKCQDSF